MNRKILTNWLRAGLALQLICEIDGCTRKAVENGRLKEKGSE
jgi:hypothetical protein